MDWSKAPDAMRRQIAMDQMTREAFPGEPLSPEDAAKIMAQAVLREKAFRALAALRDLFECVDQTSHVPLDADLDAKVREAMPAVQAGIAKLDWM